MMTASLYNQVGLVVAVSQPRFASGRGFLYNITDKLVSYQHRKARMGGDIDATISFNVSDLDLQEWFEEGIGREITVFDATGTIIFSGYTDQVTISIAGKQEIRGPLSDCGNNVKVVYSTVDTSVTPPVVGVRKSTAYTQNATSQARYGIITKILSTGGATSTEALRYRNLFLREFAFPRSSGTFTSSGNPPTVTIVVRGYYNYLSFNPYNTTASGAINVSTKISNIVAADPNAIFSAAVIQTNTFQVSAWEDEDRLEEELIRSLVNLGDAADGRWSFEVYEVGKVYYRAVPAIDPPMYVYSISDNQLYTMVGGERIDPWKIQPAQWIFTKDWMLGKVTAGADYENDPRYRLIEEVQYNAPYGWTINGAVGTRVNQIVAKLQMKGY